MRRLPRSVGLDPPRGLQLDQFGDQAEVAIAEHTCHGIEIPGFSTGQPNLEG